MQRIYCKKRFNSFYKSNLIKKFTQLQGSYNISIYKNIRTRGNYNNFYHIKSIDLQNFLKGNDIVVESKSAFHSLKYFDQDQDGQLSFKEFLLMVLPVDNSILRAEVVKRPTYSITSNDILPYEIEYALAKLIYREIEMYEKLEKLKEELAECYDFNILECFKNIDLFHTRFIDYENITRFLKQKRVKPKEEDIVAFIRRLDRDLDCRLSYTEFMEGIMPAEMKNKRKSYTTHTKSHLCRSGSKHSTPVRQSTYRRAASRPATRNLNLRKNPSYLTPMKSSNLSMVKSKSRKAMKSTNHSTFNLRSSSPSVSPFRIAKPKSDKKSYFSISKKKVNYEIFDLMKDQIKMENTLETIKQDLAIKKDVSLPLLYSMFDYSSKGITNVTDLMEALQRFKVNAKIDEVYLLFNRFDRDIKGALNYSEVCDIFLPMQSEYASIFSSRKYFAGTAISPETEMLIQHLLQTYIEVEIDLRKCKKRLIDFHPRSAFKLCDVRNRGFFTIEDMEEFLTAHKIYPSLNELSILLDKYDKNKDGKVTFNEFLRELQMTGQFYNNNPIILESEWGNEQGNVIFLRCKSI